MLRQQAKPQAICELRAGSEKRKKVPRLEGVRASPGLCSGTESVGLGALTLRGYTQRPWNEPEEPKAPATSPEGSSLPPQPQQDSRCEMVRTSTCEAGKAHPGPSPAVVHTGRPGPVLDREGRGGDSHWLAGWAPHPTPCTTPGLPQKVPRFFLPRR